jgi:hypothetical protein
VYHGIRCFGQVEDLEMDQKLKDLVITQDIACKSKLASGADSMKINSAALAEHCPKLEACMNDWKKRIVSHSEQEIKGIK